jgi:hypothetical protein
MQLGALVLEQNEMIRHQTEPEGFYATAGL